MTTKLTEIESNLLNDIRSGKGLQASLAPLVKRVMESALEGELEEHLNQESMVPNRRNGKSHKRMKSSLGDFDLATPRDRNSDFEPQIIKKRQTVFTDDLDNKILSLYANGMSYSDIRLNLEEIYQVEISNGSINRITDRIIPELEEWRTRPLKSVYTILFLDAIHFKVREEGKIVPKAIYSLVGIDNEGMKDILGLYIDSSEGSHFWASVLASLKERGVEDILIACVVMGLRAFLKLLILYSHKLKFSFV